MRTSSKIIIAAFLLTVVSLFGYDCLLKASYLSGGYKNPFSDYESLNFKDFDTVNVVSSTTANVKFVQGDFSVKIDRGALEYVKVKQQGRLLQIDANFKDHYYGNPNTYILIISCPKLTGINANATYKANKKPVTDTIVREDWNMRQLLIDGFKQDSLNVNQDYGSTVVFANNTIRSVNAVIGKSPGSSSKIVILKGNQFQNATLDIRNKSKLLLNDADITHLKYLLADSAKLVLNGAAVNLKKK